MVGRASPWKSPNFTVSRLERNSRDNLPESLSARRRRTRAFPKVARAKNATVLARACRKRARDGECGGAYDGRFPVGRIKNSVLKRPWPGQPFVKGDRRAPLHTRGHAQCVGACVSWRALFTQRQPPEYETTESRRVAVSLSICPFYPRPPSFSLSLSFARAFLAVFSFAPVRTSSLEYRRGQAHDALWDPSRDASQSGHGMTILL